MYNVHTARPQPLISYDSDELTTVTVAASSSKKIARSRHVFPFLVWLSSDLDVLSFQFHVVPLITTLDKASQSVAACCSSEKASQSVAATKLEMSLFLPRPRLFLLLLLLAKSSLQAEGRSCALTFLHFDNAGEKNSIWMITMTTMKMIKVITVNESKKSGVNIILLTSPTMISLSIKSFN